MPFFHFNNQTGILDANMGSTFNLSAQDIVDLDVEVFNTSEADVSLAVKLDEEITTKDNFPPKEDVQPEPAEKKSLEKTEKEDPMTTVTVSISYKDIQVLGIWLYDLASFPSPECFKYVEHIVFIFILVESRSCPDPVQSKQGRLKHLF